jgi:hypothetical protein
VLVRFYITHICGSCCVVSLYLLATKASKFKPS